MSRKNKEWFIATKLQASRLVVFRSLVKYSRGSLSYRIISAHTRSVYTPRLIYKRTARPPRAREDSVRRRPHVGRRRPDYWRLLWAFTIGAALELRSNREPACIELPTVIYRRESGPPSRPSVVWPRRRDAYRPERRCGTDLRRLSGSRSRPTATLRSPMATRTTHVVISDAVIDIYTGYTPLPSGMCRTCDQTIADTLCMRSSHSPRLYLSASLAFSLWRLGVVVSVVGRINEVNQQIIWNVRITIRDHSHSTGIALCSRIVTFYLLTYLLTYWNLTGDSAWLNQLFSAPSTASLHSAWAESKAGVS